MKKVIMMIFIAATLAVVGCGRKISGDDGGWTVVQSPSGVCYEAYDKGLGNHRVFSLGREIDCPPELK